MFVRFDLFSCSNMCLSVCNCFFQFSPASDTYMCMKVETETFAHPENQEQTKFYFSVDRVTSKEYLWINDGVLLWSAYTTTNKFIAIFRYFEMRRNIHWKNRPFASINSGLFGEKTPNNYKNIIPHGTRRISEIGVHHVKEWNQTVSGSSHAMFWVHFRSF